MQSQYRVACVRIPRFPIAAVWRGTVGGGQATEQLEIPGFGVRGPGSGNDMPAPRQNLASAPRNPESTPPGPRTPDPGPPLFDDSPLALAQDDVLRTVSSGAARARVRPGMTIAAARALCAELQVMPWDDAFIARAVNALTIELIAASPQVVPVANEPGLWWVGAGGLDGVGGEEAFARALLRVAREWHPRARVAIADGCVAARAATWSARHLPITIVPPGGDAGYLAPAPLALIPMDAELRDTLAALGITTAGDVAALEAEDVERRWGDEGLAVWRLARGDDERRPALTAVVSPREVSAELPVSVTTHEPLLFLVRAALDRLVTGLVSDARSAATIAVTLTLDDRRSALPWGAPPHTVTREVRFPRPTARVEPLFEQCRALLERWPLTAPVSAVRVSVTATATASGEQGDLLATRWRDPAAVDAAFARLRAELGPGTVVHPVARDDHRPEKAGAWEEHGGSGGDVAPAGAEAEGQVTLPLRSDGAATAGARASRLLESPEEVQIERAGGVPSAVWWRGERVDIAVAQGPERLSGEWWQARYRRDYWRCESERGALLLFRDALEQDRWYVQGWAD